MGMLSGKGIGKISSVSFGYLDKGRLGLSFELDTTVYSVMATLSTHDETPDRQDTYDAIIALTKKLLIDAKVSELYQLRGKPVEAEFKDGQLKSWRILTEVL